MLKPARQCTTPRIFSTTGDEIIDSKVVRDGDALIVSCEDVWRPSAVLLPELASARALTSTSRDRASFRPCHRRSLSDMPTCRFCVASASLSRVVVNPPQILIHSIAAGCRRKMLGGDAWVVHFETDASEWRASAQSLDGNGTYAVHVPGEELGAHNVTASIWLWFSSREPDFLESRWWILHGNTPMSGRSFPAFPPELTRSVTMAPRAAIARSLVDLSSGIHCTGQMLSTVQLARASVSDTSWPSEATRELQAPPARTGRWVRRGSCALLGLGDCGGGGDAAQMADAVVWAPFSCRARQRSNASGLHAESQKGCPRCAPDVLNCLAGRRLIVIGDSVSNGFALDVCERLGGRGGGCAEWHGPEIIRGGGIDASSTPFATDSKRAHSRLVMSNIFGFPPRIGLPAVVSSSRVLWSWAAALATANETVVILQSGAHDVSLHPIEDRLAPLAAYRSNLRKLAALLAAVRAANPTVHFVWRQTTHQLLVNEKQRGTGSEAAQRVLAQAAGQDSCSTRAYPGTHPNVIDALNDAAREIMASAGAIIWEEPATVTLSAPSGGWRDAQHHDVCGAGGNRHDGSDASLCAAQRRAGTHRLGGWAHSAAIARRGRSWETLGGVSEAITDTFFTRVLGCDVCLLPL